jgi:hypothetical protein
VSSVWVVNGLLVGVMALARGATGAGAGRLRVGTTGGAVAARGRRRDGVGLTVANLVECALIVGWVRRDVDDLSHSPSLTGVARDALLSTVVACGLSALLAWPFVLTREGAERWRAC